MIYDINHLKSAYKVLTEIMENEHLVKDTSFVRVRSFISNKICDMLVAEDNNHNINNR